MPGGGGRPRGTTNARGHKAGGARDGAGKPKSSTDVRPTKQGTLQFGQKPLPQPPQPIQQRATQQPNQQPPQQLPEQTPQQPVPQPAATLPNPAGLVAQHPITNPYRQQRPQQPAQQPPQQLPQQPPQQLPQQPQEQTTAPAMENAGSNDGELDDYRRRMLFVRKRRTRQNCHCPARNRQVDQIVN